MVLAFICLTSGYQLPVSRPASLPTVLFLHPATVCVRARPNMQTEAAQLDKLEEQGVVAQGLSTFDVLKAEGEAVLAARAVVDAAAAGAASAIKAMGLKAEGEAVVAARAAIDAAAPKAASAIKAVGLKAEGEAVVAARAAIDAAVPGAASAIKATGLKAEGEAVVAARATVLSEFEARLKLVRLKRDGAQVVTRRAIMAEALTELSPNTAVVGTPPQGFEWASSLF